MNTRSTLVTVSLVAIALAAGWWGRGLLSTDHQPSGGAQTSSADGPCPNGAEPLYWKAPMDPSYVRDQPGKSPMGMDLVPECPGAAERSA